MNASKFEYAPSAFLNYYTVGQGKPLLILHGWGSSANLMSNLANALADIRYCIIPDLPGFGSSPEPPKAWDVGDYTQVVYRLMVEQLGYTNFDVLAHSFGGRMMLKWLSDSASYSVQPQKVLLTGAAGLKPKRSWRFYYRKYLAKTLKAPFLILPEPFKSKTLEWLRTTKVWRSLGSSDYQQLSGIMRESFVKTVNEYLDHTLPKIEKELFLLWGENDEATPMDQAKRLEKGLKHVALVTIEGAGHYAFLEKPSEFFAIAKAYYTG